MHANTAQRVGNAFLSLLGYVGNIGDNFLRKDVADTARGLITFLKGIHIGSGPYCIDADGHAVFGDTTAESLASADFEGCGWQVHAVGSRPHGVG